MDRALGNKICGQGRLGMEKVCVSLKNLGELILFWHITINHSGFVMCFCLEVKNCS